MAAIAEKAGVSKATVSRALAGSTLIGEAAREQVELTARELGYIRRSVKRPRERIILTVKLVLPPEGNRSARLFYSFTDLVEGLQRGLSPRLASVTQMLWGTSEEDYGFNSSRQQSSH